jgi:hypothetical protein
MQTGTAPKEEVVKENTYAFTFDPAVLFVAYPKMSPTM